MSDDAPFLPPELEREILELVALSDPQYIPRLLAVNRRARIWIEPLRFKILVFSVRVNNSPKPLDQQRHYISMPQFSHALASKPKSFFERHVRHIFISEQFGTEDLHKVFSACTGATNLAFTERIDASLIPLISALPLQRLALNLRNLFPSPVPLPDFSPLFAKITHLHLITSNPHAVSWPHLATLPNLTHFAFTTEVPSEDTNPTEILQQCPSLQVLWVQSWFWRVMASTDSRFVSSPGDPASAPSIEDWTVGARGGEDGWYRAEALVTKRLARGKPERETVIL
ncbi:hypothetical protein FB45DRAFT_1007895 [Roridomyces roridus]|uniref:Uncharacterized protein n=1 Tax=Roridomyces roridus TaxID=1738132 RepID=A0AAD7BCZ4_9AGAR|nr:hypothetical protein FB45DRAFT_1007895 [Roridomyces roridus]